MTFPFETGLYSVAPGLKRLASPALSIAGLPRYYAEKRAAASRRAVYLEHSLPPSTRQAATEALLSMATREHPGVYRLAGDRLYCEALSASAPLSLEEIPFLLTADLAVVQLTGSAHFLAALHVCLPSSWRIEDKIGRAFSEVHRPVPGIPLVGADQMMRSLATRGPFERFAWGLSNADILDQATAAHSSVEPAPLFVRLERQTTHPLPGCDAWLFLIHPTNYAVSSLTMAQRQSLAAALASMTPEQAAYKGLASTRSAVVDALLHGAP